MPAYKKQHFVPRFYLKWFANNEKSINLYNWNAGKPVYGAPLKGQCYRDNFYGADGVLEKTLGSLEASISRYFRTIHRHGRLPDRLSGHHDELLTWILLQSSRTAYAADMLDEMTDHMMKAALIHHPEVTAGMLDKIKIRLSQPVRAAMAYKTPAFPLIRDLHMKLVVSTPGTEFITSDAPVVAHNQMMRWRTEAISTTGLIWMGLQFFTHFRLECCFFYMTRTSMSSAEKRNHTTA